jgi:sulfite reductase (NADPH) flavoprotein alpha-component
MAMAAAPLIPESAPFTAEQRAWLNGFVAGLLGAPAPGVAAPAPRPAGPPVLVAYGSQSGNAEALAKKLAKDAAAKGFAARACGLESVDPAALAREGNLLLVTSTWGDGEMPDNATSFWQQINRNGSSPSLHGLRFSVLALGDRNYGDTFCQAGRMLDERLAELGATRIAPRTDCDVDFDEPAQHWSEAVFAVLGNGAAADGRPGPSARPEPAAGPAAHSKKNPFPAKLLECVRLNGEGSAKDTRHVAFSLEGSGLAYEAGDALGVFARNDPAVVDAVIAAQGYPAGELVALPGGGEAPLREALLSHYECRQQLGAPRSGIPLGEWVASLR